MKHMLRLALYPLFVLLLCLVGCDSETDATATEPDASAQLESGLAVQPEAIGEVDPTLIGTAGPRTDDIAVDPIPPVDPVDPSAFIVIQNADPRSPQELARQLQQVLHKTQVVKVVQSPNLREIKLEVTNIKDVKALANKIPFGAVESVDVRSRTITVDFDL